MIDTRNFIKMLISKKLDHATIQEIGSNNIIYVDNINHNFKNGNIYFDDSSKKSVLDKPINKRDIMLISRIKPKDEYDYTYIISLKDGRAYTIRLTYKKNYSPYVLSESALMNNKTIMYNISEYLENFKGKRVLMKHASYSDIFTTVNGKDSNEETNITTNSYIVTGFDYASELKNGVPCISCYDSESTYTTCFIPNISMIDNDDNKVFISAENGEYTLNAI